MFYNVCRFLYSAKILYYEVAYLDIVCAIEIVMRFKFHLVEFISWNTKDTSCLDLLALDAAYLYTTGLSAGAFFDKILGQPNDATSQEATLHYLKGVRFLRERLLLRDEEEKVSNATLSVSWLWPTVLTAWPSTKLQSDIWRDFVIYPGWEEDCPVSGTTIFVKGFWWKCWGMWMLLFPTPLLLLLEIWNIWIQPRIDIGLALQTSSKPILFSDSLLEPLPPYPNQKLWVVRKSLAMSNSQHFFKGLDEALSAAWVALQRFCSPFNLATEIHRIFHVESVMDTMAAVMYRLLHMSFLSGSIDETIRLGLLSL